MKVWIDLVSILLLSLVINSANATINLGSPIITNFVQLVRAVESGDDVKAIVHLDRCQITDPAIQAQLTPLIISASTRFNFTQYFHYNGRFDGQQKDTVTTTMSSLVEQSTPGLFWKVFARLSVFDDNTANLHVDYYDPIHHKSQMVVEWLCDISNGRDANGLILIDSF